jgi:hypothetical protein
VSLGGVRAASWFVFLACGSDGLLISEEFIVCWMQVSLINDCSDAN